MSKQIIIIEIVASLVMSIFVGVYVVNNMKEHQRPMPEETTTVQKSHMGWVNPKTLTKEGR